MPITMKFFRSEIVRKKLEALPAAMTAPVREALMEAGQMVVARAQMLAPVDEGVLKASIRAVAEPTAGRQNVQALRIGPDGKYLKDHGRVTNLPRFVEFGTKAQKKGQTVVSLNKRGRARKRKSTGDHAGTPARPFLFPAWQQTKRAARKKIADAVNAVLKKAKR